MCSVGNVTAPTLHATFLSSRCPVEGSRISASVEKGKMRGGGNRGSLPIKSFLSQLSAGLVGCLPLSFQGCVTTQSSACHADVNECNNEGAGHNCDANAACTNTAGSFTCSCNAGFSGDGVTCTGVSHVGIVKRMCACVCVKKCRLSYVAHSGLFTIALPYRCARSRAAHASPRSL